MLKWIQEAWCKRVHRRAMWPIKGKYICARCLREYPVKWELSREGARTEAARAGAGAPVTGALGVLGPVCPSRQKV
jgi:hypothetical protein